MLRLTAPSFIEHSNKSEWGGVKTEEEEEPGEGVIRRERWSVVGCWVWCR